MLKPGIIPDGATRWARYRLGYHLVWVPKYRRAVLRDDVVKTLRGALSRACDVAGYALLAAEADRDHAHVFVSAPPAVSPADIARVLKGASSRAIRAAHPDVARHAGPRGLWSQSYYAGTVGDMSATTVRHYIENCQGPKGP